MDPRQVELKKAGERVATLEIGFLDRLVTRLASSFAARPHDHHDACDCSCVTLIDTFITVAENRFGFLSTAVYKHLLKKLVQRVDHDVHDTILAPVAVQEIVFFLDVFRQALSNYQLRHGIVAVEDNVVESKQEVEPATEESAENFQDFSGTIAVELLNVLTQIYAEWRKLPEDQGMKLKVTCEQLYGEVSYMHGPVVLAHVQQLLIACLDANAEQKGAFTMLALLRSLRLDLNGILRLCTSVNDTVSTPGGNWKKPALLELAGPLFAAIMTWVSAHPDEVTALYTNPDPNKSRIFFTLCEKIESWSSGSKKRGAVWPILVVLLTFCPNALKNAAKDLKDAGKNATASGGVVARILSVTQKSLTPGLLQNHAQQFQELSVKSLVTMEKVLGYVLRTLRGNSEAGQLTDVLQQYLVSNRDKVIELLFVNPPFNTRENDGEEGVEIGLALFEDMIWSLFYSDNQRFIQVAMNIFLAPSSTSHFKKVFIRALTRILPHEIRDKQLSPSTWKLPPYPELRERFFDLLELYVNGGTSIAGRAGPQDGDDKARWKMRRQASMAPAKLQGTGPEARLPPAQLDTETISLLLQLSARSPWFVLVRGVMDPVSGNGLYPSKFVQHLGQVFRNIGACLCMPDAEELHDDACIALEQLHDPFYVPLYYPREPYVGFMALTRVTHGMLAEQLLTSCFNNRGLSERLLNVLFNILSRSNAYLVQASLLGDPPTPQPELVAGCGKATSLIEAALIVHISLGDLNLNQLAAMNLAALCEMQEHLGDDSCGLEVPLPTDVYREVCNAIATSPSSRLQQKTIRTLLAKVRRPTLGIQKALAHIYRRWGRFTSEFNNAPSEEQRNSLLGTDRFQIWTNHTGLLVALSNGMLRAGDQAKSQQAVETKEKSSSAQRSPPPTPGGPPDSDDGKSISEYDQELSGVPALKPFIAELMQLVAVRSNRQEKRFTTAIMSAIGLHLPSLFVPQVLVEVHRHMEDRLQSINKAAPTGKRVAISDFRTPEGRQQTLALFSNILGMLELTFDRRGSLVDIESAEDVEDLMRLCIQVVNRLADELEAFDEHTPEFNEHFSLKRKMGEVLDALFRAKDIPTGTIFRLEMLDVLVDWTYNCLDRHQDLNTRSIASQVGSASKNVDESSRDSTMPAPISLRERTISNSGSSTLDRFALGAGAAQSSLKGSMSMSMSMSMAMSIQEKDIQVLSQYHQTEISLMRALAEAAINLELHPAQTKEREGMVSVDGVMSEEAKSRPNELSARSRLFYKYFHVLSCVLSTCDPAKIAKGASATMRSLEQATLTAMSNLLHANAEVGFFHVSKAAAYDESDEMRATFLHVFSEILRRQALFTTESAEEEAKYDDVLAELREQVLTSEFSLQLLWGITQGKEAEEMAVRLATVFEAHREGYTLRLHQWLIERELADTHRLGTLFRGESLCTKLMGHYFSRFGQTYMRNVVGTFLRELLADPELSQLDPPTNADDSTTRVNKLRSVASAFLNRIIASKVEFPMLLQHLCTIMRTEVSRRFPDTEGVSRIAVGGYVFLRFICPAVAMPTKYGVLSADTDLSMPVRKALVLVAKVLQNVANGTHFHEDNLAPMNDWIDEHMPLLDQFAEDLSQQMHEYQPEHVEFDAGKEPLQAGEQAPAVDLEVLAEIHCFLFRHEESVSSILEQLNLARPSDHRESLLLEDLQSILMPERTTHRTLGEALPTILKRLGSPPQRLLNPQASLDSAGLRDRRSVSVSELESFMVTQMARPGFAEAQEQIKDKELFYHHKSDNKLVFFYIARRVDPVMDRSFVMYHIIQELKLAVQTNAQFDVVVDGMAFDKDPYMQASGWYAKLKGLLEGNVAQYLDKVYVVYPTANGLEFTKSLMKQTGLRNRVVAAKLKVCSRPSDLFEFVPCAATHLPASTLNVEREMEHNFQATIYSRPMRLYLTSQFLCMEAAEKALGQEFKRTEFLSLARIDDVRGGSLSLSEHRRQQAAGKNSKIASSSQSHTVVVTYSHQGPQTLKMQTQTAHQLASALCTAITHLKQQQALEEVSKGADAETVTASAIPGILLHLCLFNLFSVNQSTQRAAYCLFAQLVRSFELPCTAPVATSDSLTIPNNPLAFALSVSSELAVLAPQYTMDFLEHCSLTLEQQGISSGARAACVQFMRPWVQSLAAILYCSSIRSDDTLPGEDSSTEASSASVQPFNEGTTAKRVAAMKQSDSLLRIMDLLQNKDDDTLMGEAEEFLVKMINATTISSGSEAYFLSDFWNEIAQDERLTTLTMKVFISSWMAFEGVRQDESSDSASHADTTVRGIAMVGGTVPDPLNVAHQATLRRKPAHSMSVESLSAFKASEGNYNPNTQQSAELEQLPRVSGMMLDICAMLSAQQPDVVCDAIIPRFMDLLPILSAQQHRRDMQLGGSSTSQGSSAFECDDPNSALWREAQALLRPLLFVSSNNRTLVIKHTPALFQIILMFVGHGSRKLRPGIHALSCNIVHTIMAMVEGAPDTADLHVGQIEHLRDALATVNGDAIQFLMCDPRQNWMNMPTFQSIAAVLVQSMTSCAGPTATQWRDSWWQMALAHSSTSVPSVSASRSCVIMGLLATEKDVTKRIVAQLLRNLHVAVKSATDPGEDFHIESLLRSLSRIARVADVEANVVLFWPAVSFLMYGMQPVFQEAAQLLMNVLGRLVSLAGEIEEVLLNLRQANAQFEDAFGSLESPTMFGISFASNFSFAMAATMMRGLNIGGCRDTVIDTLNILHEITQDGRVSGYASLLLLLQKDPSRYARLPEPPRGSRTASIDSATSPTFGRRNTRVSRASSIFRDSNFSSTDKAGDVWHIVPGFFNTDNFDERRAVLFLLMSLSFVRCADNDHDKLFAYSVLRQFVKERPEIIFRMHDVVFAELTRLFQDTNDMMLMATIELVKSCFAHVRSDSQLLLSQPSEINERGLAYLHSIKFSEIFHVGSFSSLFPFHSSEDRKNAAAKVLGLLEAAAVVFENSSQP